jgi:hypothetical protein
MNLFFLELSGHTFMIFEELNLFFSWDLAILVRRHHPSERARPDGAAAGGRERGGVDEALAGADLAQVDELPA